MPLLTSYDNLLQTLKDTAEDDGTEFANFAPTAIALAEDLLNKELDLPDLSTETATGTITDGSFTINKPTGYKHTEQLNITVGTFQRSLVKRLKTFIDDYWPNAALEDTPKYYTDLSETQFKVAPTADADYAYTLTYFKAPTKLGSSNQTNYFINNCSDILYHACMIEIAKFMKAWSQVQLWEAKYVQLRDAWNINQGRKRRDGQHTPQNPDGGPNSLKHTINSNA